MEIQKNLCQLRYVVFESDEIPILWSKIYSIVLYLIDDDGEYCHKVIEYVEVYGNQRQDGEKKNMKFIGWIESGNIILSNKYNQQKFPLLLQLYRKYNYPPHSFIDIEHVFSTSKI